MLKVTKVWDIRFWARAQLIPKSPPSASIGMGEAVLYFTLYSTCMDGKSSQSCGRIKCSNRCKGETEHLIRERLRHCSVPGWFVNGSGTINCCLLLFFFPKDCRRAAVIIPLKKKRGRSPGTSVNLNQKNQKEGHKKNTPGASLAQSFHYGQQHTSPAQPGSKGMEQIASFHATTSSLILTIKAGARSPFRWKILLFCSNKVF